MCVWLSVPLLLSLQTDQQQGRDHQPTGSLPVSRYIHRTGEEKKAGRYQHLIYTHACKQVPPRAALVQELSSVHLEEASLHMFRGAAQRRKWAMKESVGFNHTKIGCHKRLKKKSKQSLLTRSCGSDSRGVWNFNLR